MRHETNTTIQHLIGVQPSVSCVTVLHVTVKEALTQQWLMVDYNKVKSNINNGRSEYTESGELLKRSERDTEKCNILQKKLKYEENSGR